MMKRQCKLEKNEFLDLANCPLSAENYFEILKRNGVITESDMKLMEDNTSAQLKKKRTIF